MGKNKLVLGRGLASLIPNQSRVTGEVATQGADDGRTEGITANIDLKKIQKNPFQPRADFDALALDELKRSILEKGVIQPITVRRFQGGYQLISGERRVRAARDAGLSQIPAYIIHVASEEEMLELALVENLQREHLNPIEVAISYRRLIEECKFTQDEVARKIGKDRSTITNFLRLLKLPEEIQAGVRKGELSGGHARALVAVDDQKTQLAIYRKIKEKDLSVRQVERLVREKGERKGTGRSTGTRAAAGNLSSVEDRIRQLLGTRVQVKQFSGGRGEIVIEFYSGDDLDRLIEIFESLNNRYH